MVLSTYLIAKLFRNFVTTLHASIQRLFYLSLYIHIDILNIIKENRIYSTMRYLHFSTGSVHGI